MARSSTSKQIPRKAAEAQTEEQAKVDALNWLVRQLSWEESLSALRGDAPTTRRRTRAPKPAPRTAA
jgi:hypothetical protein